MANVHHTLYIGVTNDLERRIWDHKHKVTGGFTAKYNLDRLVYYEEFDSPQFAICGEKRIKGWVRRKKVALIESSNPIWADLSKGWDEGDATPGRTDSSLRSE